MAEEPKNWINELADLQLPALTFNKRHLEKSLRRPSDEPEIGPIIGQDPGLLLRLFHEFAASEHGSQGVALDPTRIAGLLGAERVEELARTTPTLEECYHGAALKGLQLSYGRALHSAAFARKLATLRGKTNSDEYGAVGLLQNLGEMALWARKPGTMNLLWGDLQRPEELDFKGLKRFGIAPSELGEALARRWGLPLQVILAQRMNHSFDPNVQLPLLAASLAWAGLNDWRSDETAELIRLAADLTQLEPDMVRDQILRAAAETARTAYAMELPHGGDRLLLPPQPVTAASHETAKSAAPRAPGSSGNVPFPGTETITAAAVRISSDRIPMRITEGKISIGNESARSSRALQQLERILQEMRDELGLERIMVAMLTADREQIRSRFVLEGRHSDIDRFTVSAKKHNLFGMMLRRPHALWIRPDNRERYRPFIPAHTDGLLHAGDFFAASILTGNKPIGLIYADGSDAPLDRPRFEGFKRQCHRITRLFSPQKKDQRA